MRLLLNGEVIAPEEARVSALDHGLLYGYGLFETMRAVSGRVPFLEAHLDRLERGAERLGIPLPQPRSEIADGLRRLVTDDAPADARVRLTLTMGPESGPTWFATIQAHAERLDSYRACFVEGHPGGQAPTSGLKTLSHLPWLLARKQAREKGFDEALMLDAGGLVIEGSTSNLFVLTPQGSLLTPSLETGPLEGIARAWAIAQLRAWGQEVEEVLLTRSDVLRAREVFVTNALRGAVAVAQVDDKRLPDASPSWESRLRQAFQDRFQAPN